MDIKSLVKEHPAWIIGGGALALYLGYQMFAGGSQPAAVDYGSGSGISTGTPNSAASGGVDVSSQIAASQQTTLASVGQMLQGYQDTETQALQGLSQGFTQTLANMQSQNQAMQTQFTQQLQASQAQTESTVQGLTQSIAAIQSQNSTSINNLTSALADLKASSVAAQQVSYPQVTVPYVPYAPVAPVTYPQQQAPAVVSSSGNSNSVDHYNTIGGGSTSTKPANTTLNNGNTIKYDNGPHGWTEYNSSGDAVRWGTASPY